MRRFSQRNSLVTLSDINITPLLDLAFVLLIIFVITTPLLEKGLPMKLSKGGTTDDKIEKKDIRTLEITARGEYFLDHQPMKLAAAEAKLVQDFHANPNLIVYIRADKGGTVDSLLAAVEGCRRNGITRYSFRTEADNGK
jgi:biopolymer transport protein ExbD/biopolymer transport protein TolR